MDTPRWVRTDSGGFADFPGTGHTPQSLGTLPQLVPVVSAPSEMRCGHFPLDAHTCWWCTQSPVSVHTPQLVPMVSGPPRCALPPPPVLWIWSPYPHTSVGMQMGGWLGGEETGAVAAGKLPKVPPRVFFFLGKSSCSILQLPPYKEGPVLLLSPPLQLDQDCLGQGPTQSKSQLFPAGAHGLHRFTTSFLFQSL